MNDAPIEFPIDGVLDLHTFRPKEVRGLLDEYLAECRRRGILDLRVIHGKGTGALREMVHAHLKRHPLVESFSLAGSGAGGWGATLVRLKK
jgi:DNA-nicking Smr family endonuclease